MSGPSSFTVWLNQEIQAGRQNQYQSEKNDPIECTEDKNCKNPWCLDAAKRFKKKYPHWE